MSEREVRGFIEKFRGEKPRNIRTTLQDLDSELDAYSGHLNQEYVTGAKDTIQLIRGLLEGEWRDYLGLERRLIEGGDMKDREPKPQEAIDKVREMLEANKSLVTNEEYNASVLTLEAIRLAQEEIDKKNG